jgi:hypothetical protein
VMRRNEQYWKVNGPIQWGIQKLLKTVMWKCFEIKARVCI